MNTFSALRQLSEQKFHLHEIQSQLLQHGYKPVRTSTVDGQRYLRFYGEFKNQALVQGLIELSTWGNSALPQLTGIDWLSVDARVLPPLFSEQGFNPQITNRDTSFSQTQALELVSLSNSTYPLMSLDTDYGLVLIESYKSLAKSQTLPVNERMGKIPVPLTFSLGKSILPFHVFSSMEIGDVLLIEIISGHISSYGKILFQFQFEQEYIMLSPATETNEVPATTDTENTESLSGLNSLPIELSIILMRKLIPLTELTSYHPGDIVKISADNLLNIEVRANNQCIARGELIQLSTGQLGVEIQSCWPQENIHA